MQPQSTRHTHTQSSSCLPQLLVLDYKAFVVELILRFDVALLSLLTKLPPRSKRPSTKVTIQTPRLVSVHGEKLTHTHTQTYTHPRLVCYRGSAQIYILTPSIKLQMHTLQILTYFVIIFYLLLQMRSWFSFVAVSLNQCCFSGSLNLCIMQQKCYC